MCDHCIVARRDVLRPRLVEAFMAYIDALVRGDEHRAELRAKYEALREEYELCVS